MTTRTNESQETELQFSLTDIFRALKSRGWIGLVTAMAVGLCYWLVLLRTQVPLYASSATFTVSITNDYGNSTSAYNTNTAKQMAATFPYILKSGVLENMVAADLGYTALPGSLQAEAVENTSLFTLRAVATTPQLAYDILQSVIENYPRVAEFVVGPTNLTLIDETGVATDPANSISYARILLVAVAVGAVVDAAVCLLYLLFHHTVGSVEEMKHLFHARCLAVIPQVKRKKGSDSAALLITQRRINRGFVEAIYRLRTGVERTGAKVILVNSAIMGEGKSTVSTNLALALAKTGRQVVLIDADLRHPLVGGYLGLSKEACRIGLADYLKGNADLSNIGFSVSNMNNLIVIPGGSATADSTELLARPAMKELIAALRDHMDYVIVDAPPSAVLADAAVVSPLTDGVLYVVKQDYASTDDVLRGTENVTADGTPLIGMVMNAGRTGETGTYRATSRSYGG